MIIKKYAIVSIFKKNAHNSKTMRLLLKKFVRFWSVINWSISSSRFIVVLRDILYKKFRFLFWSSSSVRITLKLYSIDYSKRDPPYFKLVYESPSRLKNPIKCELKISMDTNSLNTLDNNNILTLLNMNRIKSMN